MLWNNRQSHSPTRRITAPHLAGGLQRRYSHRRHKIRTVALRRETVMNRESLPKSITGISHSGFYVDDLDRTTEFYTKVLGARVAWRNDKSENPLMKLYIGDFGLSIIKWPPDVPKFEVPHAIHWAYRIDPATAEETVEYIKSCGIDVEGPVGHKREEGILNWFFLDPDNYRVEVEARFASAKEAAEVLERGKANRKSEMGLYGGDPVRKTQKA
jgi:catechol 2,3-dioxygenase-like lactoylglutathione lyase family enzyme